VARSSDNEAQRLKLLAMLKQYVDAHSKSNADSWPRLLLDDAAEGPFNFWEQPEEQRRRYQDDELHLTAEGYDFLGGHVFGMLRDGGVAEALRCGAG
jgi:lysophospholipase L1-like esterase